MLTFKDAKYIVSSLAKDIRPCGVILFGSVAAKGAGDDLDLLVITDKEKMRDQVASSLSKFYKNFDIDYFIISTDTYIKKIREGSPFLKSIRKKGRLLYMDVLEKWKDMATEDLAQAKYLQAGHFHRGACYNAQQAIEKAIKYALLKKGWDLEKSHNIRRLISFCEDYKIKLDIAAQDLNFIDSIYIGRYPADEGLLPDAFPTDEDSERAIKIAEQTFKELHLI